ncbi:Uncharacterized protein Rs2_43625 [Raphanus sativus]|nr:Uncharacterized protein Rs2_43625 [Raphanus sativus]
MVLIKVVFSVERDEWRDYLVFACPYTFTIWIFSYFTARSTSYTGLERYDCVFEQKKLQIRVSIEMLHLLPTDPAIYQLQIHHLIRSISSYKNGVKLAQDHHGASLFFCGFLRFEASSGSSWGKKNLIQMLFKKANLAI